MTAHEHQNSVSSTTDELFSLDALFATARNPCLEFFVFCFFFFHPRVPSRSFPGGGWIISWCSNLCDTFGLLAQAAIGGDADEDSQSWVAAFGRGEERFDRAVSLKRLRATGTGNDEDAPAVLRESKLARPSESAEFPDRGSSLSCSPSTATAVALWTVTPLSSPAVPDGRSVPSVPLLGARLIVA